jgi:hypothetical protein
MARDLWIRACLRGDRGARSGGWLEGGWVHQGGVKRGAEKRAADGAGQSPGEGRQPERKEQEVKAIAAATLPVPNPTLVVKAPPAVTPGPQKSPTSLPGGGERRAARGHDSARG